MTWNFDETYSDPAVNMYGFTACPQCRARFRFALAKEPQTAICDDCGFKEPKRPRAAQEYVDACKELDEYTARARLAPSSITPTPMEEIMKHSISVPAPPELSDGKGGFKKPGSRE